MSARFSMDQLAALRREGFTLNSAGAALDWWKCTNLRPAWAPGDERWREQANVLDPDDLAWIEHQWEIAGGPAPEVDTTWVTTETLGEPSWPVVLAAAIALVAGGVMILVAWWSAGGH